MLPALEVQRRGQAAHRLSAVDRIAESAGQPRTVAVVDEVGPDAQAHVRGQIGCGPEADTVPLGGRTASRGAVLLPVVELEPGGDAAAKLARQERLGAAPQVGGAASLFGADISEERDSGGAVRGKPESTHEALAAVVVGDKIPAIGDAEFCVEPRTELAIDLDP